MAELTAADKIRLGKEAERLLKKGSVLDMAITAATRDAIANFMDSDPGSEDAMKWHVKMKGMSSVKEYLTLIMNEGAVAAKQERSGG